MKRFFAKYGFWLFAAAGCICVVLAFNYMVLELRVALADEQVSIFKSMEADAMQSSDPAKVTGFLQYVVDYYPSGTKQVKGSALDRLVEDERSRSIAAIVNRLRALTGRDAGSDPRDWL